MKAMEIVRGQYGSGSLQKKGNSWLLRWRFNGKQHAKRLKSVLFTKTQARAELQRLLGLDPTEEAARCQAIRERMTVSELLEMFMKEYSLHTLSDSTQETYRQVIDMHLVPALGGIRLADITKQDIRDCLRNILENGSPGGRGPLSPTTIKKVYRLLHKALSWAVDEQIISHNPAYRAFLPTRPAEYSDEDDPEKMQILTEEELGRVLVAASKKLINGHTEKDNPWFIPIVIAANTGMRQGEILGIKWDCVDLEGATIKITRALQNVTGKRRMKKPKTKYSRRTIRIDPFTVSVLKKHRKAQDARKASAGSLYIDQGFVCAREYGKPMYGPNVTNGFKKVLKKCGVREIRFHDLRHTHASILINAGVDIIKISRRLGHARPSITLDIYGHLIPGKVETSMTWYERLLPYLPSDVK